MTKKISAVRVFDLKSTSGSFVGNEKIRKGKDYRLFRGGSVRIGESVLTVNQLDPNASSSRRESAKPPASTGRASTRSTRASRSTRSSQPEVIEVDPPAKESNKKSTGLKRRGIQLVVTEGPHEGETFTLESGGDETLIIGKNPTSTIGTIARLNKDKSLSATHLRIDLSATKSFVAVSITDKSKGRTVVNKNAVNKGRAFVNDMIKIGDSVLEVQRL